MSFPHLNSPLTFQCTQCGWKKTIPYASDVLIRVDACPKCGGEVKSHRATLLELPFAQMKLLIDLAKIAIGKK